MKEDTLTKVTMELTPQDVLNAEKLTAQLHSASKAATISKALELTAYLVGIIENGGDITMRNLDGSMEKLVLAWDK